MSAAAAYPWAHEVELLLACARPVMDARDAERAGRAVAAGVDWSRVVTLARAHGLAPLLDRHERRGAVPMPGGAVAEVRAVTASTLRRNLRLSAQLLSVLSSLERAGLRPVPLKGPVLAHRVYGSVGSRRINDIDVLVPEHEMHEALALLQRDGFSRRDDFSADQDRVFQRWTHCVSLFSPPFRADVELHGRPLHPFGRRVGFDAVAGGLRRERFMGTEIWTLAPEDEVAYLCHHGGAHAWSRLEWLATVAALRRISGVDPARLREAAARLGGWRRVEAGLALAHRLIDGPEPARDLPRGAAAANDAVIARLAANPARVIAAHREQLAYMIRTDDGHATRARRVWGIVGAPQVADLRALPLPRAGWPVYYLVRPLRLLYRFVTGRTRKSR